MLIYSNERVVPANINIMILEDKEGGYYYLHRSLYDQAVIIKDRYDGKVDALKKLITDNEDEEDIVAVKTFVETAPSPINMIGYFLYLVDGIDSMELSYVDLCGALHVMSTVINFREFLRIPKAVRAGITFSLSIREEYEVSWDRFFQEAVPLGYIPQNATQVRIPTAPVIPKENLSLEDAETEADFIALLDEDFDIDLTAGGDDEEEMIPTPEPAPEPAPSPVKSGLGLLGGL